MIFTTIYLLLIGVVVYQQEDTIVFTEQDSVVDSWVISENTHQNGSSKERMILNIDDAGQADVLYNGRHRIFSKDGNLLDVFVELK